MVGEGSKRDSFDLTLIICLRLLHYDVSLAYHSDGAKYDFIEWRLSISFSHEAHILSWKVTPSFDSVNPLSSIGRITGHRIRSVEFTCGVCRYLRKGSSRARIVEIVVLVIPYVDIELRKVA